MSDRAPLSVTFYLDADDAELFRALHEARKGERFDERRHRELVDKGLIEVEEFNPGPNGECMDDVRLTNAGERKLGELRQRAAEVFEKKRRETRGASVPDSPARDHLTRGPVSDGRHPVRRSPSGRASRPVLNSEPASSETGNPTPGDAA